MNSKANDPSLQSGSAPPESDVLNQAPPPTYEQATTYPTHPPQNLQQPGPSPAGFQYPPQSMPTQSIQPYPVQPYPIQPQPLPVHMQPHPSVHVQHLVAHAVVGPDPITITCPSCRKLITSRTELETTTRTHLAALVCLILGCCCCSCCPYFIDSCRDTHHYCPGCGAFIGAYKR